MINYSITFICECGKKESVELLRTEPDVYYAPNEVIASKLYFKLPENWKYKWVYDRRIHLCPECYYKDKTK